MTSPSRPAGYRRPLSAYAIEVHDRQKALRDDAWEVLAGQMVARLDGHPPHVLDAGAGSGLIAAWMQASGAEVAACDFNRSMLDVLRHRTADQVPPVVGDVTRLPFARSVFGGVVISNVLHLLHNWDDALRDAVRVLAPGGALFVNLGSTMAMNVTSLTETAAHFRSLVPADGTGYGPSDTAAITTLLDDEGLTTEPPLDAASTASSSIRTVIERLEHNIFAWPESVDARALSRAGAATLRWAEKRFGDVDAAHTTEVRIEISVHRK